MVFNDVLTGDPPPEVTWMRNGKLLPPSAKIRASSTSAYEHSLTLYNVTASDLGVYTCRISNGFGATDCRSTLSFDGSRYDGTSTAGAADDSAHFFQLPESTVTVGRDSDLVIECRVRGHPRPKGMTGKLEYYFIPFSFLLPNHSVSNFDGEQWSLKKITRIHLAVVGNSTVTC